MISLQAYRISVGLFQFKFKRVKVNNSIYAFKINSSKGKKNRSMGGNFGTLINMILIFFLLGVNINNNFSKIRQDDNNKVNHIKNGNIMKKGTFSLVTWNKGNGTFKNKRDDIMLTIERYRPDIFAIHEVNFDLKSDRGFENYTIEVKTLCKLHQIFRTIMLI